jgi:predicted DNA-binding transcriptional regulator AlpA
MNCSDLGAAMASKRNSHQQPAPLLTIEDLSQRLQIPKNTLYRQHSKGTPPASLGVRVGRLLRYDRTRIQLWLDRGGQK